ncbi:RidA family protein [Aidingimonas lacisalsi]|uniref:RidA family protein n=1 Tax=Aidingimonas lacisalsi TaxID=2604086 RepID=UPI0011D26039|nr:RidA family protein [Aidingimonas lacisalsi]
MINRQIKTPIMHRAVESNGFVFFGGITADDKSKDIAGQTTEVLDKLENYLSEAGTDKSKVVMATVYVSDLSNKSGLNQVWTSWFDENELPARATLGVADLGEGILLELVATAVI